MNLTPAQAGFLKGIAVAVLSAVVAYLANPEHLTLFSGSTALVIAGLASSLESFIKAQYGRALLGAVRVR